MTERVLVTDGDERAALAVVRSLGRAGLEVHTCASSARCLAGASRFARGHVRTPDPLRDPAGFAAAVDGIIDDRGITDLLPIGEASILALLANRGERSHVRLPWPEDATFRAVCDKRRVLEAASRVGIAVPRQRVLEDPTELGEVLARGVDFPLVLKPARSVGEADGARAKVSVRHAADRDELVATVASLPRAAFPLLLQQRITGAGTGLFLLIWEDRVVASFAHRRLREKPPSGGVSVLRESIPIDPGLLARAVALLREFRWSGVAMVEFKEELGTGEPYLMEVNGRFWGSLQLAIDAGVDFPLLLVRAAQGRPIAVCPRYRLGTRSRWEWGEIDHLLARLRRSDRELSLPPEAPGRWSALREVCTLGPRARGEVLRLTDPLPFARESLSWLKGALG